VIEFRKDKRARNKYKRLLHWLDKEMVGKSAQYIQEEIAERLEGYQWALRKHGIETTLGAIAATLDSKALLGSITSNLAGAYLDQTFLRVAGAAAILGVRYSIELARIALKRADITRGPHSEVSFVYEIQKSFQPVLPQDGS